MMTICACTGACLRGKGCGNRREVNIQPTLYKTDLDETVTWDEFKQGLDALFDKYDSVFRRL